MTATAIAKYFKARSIGRGRHVALCRQKLWEVAHEATKRTGNELPEEGFVQPLRNNNTMLDVNRYRCLMARDTERCPARRRRCASHLARQKGTR